MNRRKVPLEGNNSPATGAGGPAAVLNITLGIGQMAEPHHKLGGCFWPRAV